MRIAIAPAPLLAATAIVLGVAAAVGLILFSRPKDADPRMAKIRDTMAQVERLNREPGTPGVLPIGAVCDGDLVKVAQTYKAVVGKAADGHSVSATGLNIAPAPDARAGQIIPLTVQWKGSADYTAFVAVLGDLVAEKPTLFVEALDIKPRGSRAEFELKGKIWCWTPVANRS